MIPITGHFRKGKTGETVRQSAVAKGGGGWEERTEQGTQDGEPILYDAVMVDVCVVTHL
jgi:hypothetical protein